MNTYPLRLIANAAPQGRLSPSTVFEDSLGPQRKVWHLSDKLRLTACFIVSLSFTRISYTVFPIQPAIPQKEWLYNLSMTCTSWNSSARHGWKCLISWSFNLESISSFPATDFNHVIIFIDSSGCCFIAYSEGWLHGYIYIRKTQGPSKATIYDNM